MPLERSPVPYCSVIHRASDTGLPGAVEEISGVISSTVMTLEEMQNWELDRLFFLNLHFCLSPAD